MAVEPVWPKCRLCGEDVYTEHPDAVWCRNPETMRKGWMHGDCARQAHEEMSPEQLECYDELE